MYIFTLVIMFCVIHIINMDTYSAETTPETTTNTNVVPEPRDYKDLYIYLGIAAGVLLLITQTICFLVYIRKVKSKQRRYNNLTRKASIDGNYEGRYNNAPRKPDPPKPVDESNELYECMKPAVEAKPLPPPIATLPKLKTQRPPLPLPQSNADKASTFTAPSAQLFLEQFGRQVSTMPLRPAMGHLSPKLPIQSQSPNLVRAMPPISPQLLRRKSPMQEKPMIYESLPDIRVLGYNGPPTSLKHKPAMPLPSETLWNDNKSLSSIKHTPRVPLPNETSWNASGSAQSNLGIRKPPAPLPIETSRNLLQGPSTMKPNVRLGPISPRSDYRHASHATNMSNKTSDVANELMEKLRRRAELISPNPSVTPKKQSTSSWTRENPKKCVEEDSSDEEWTMEELKAINMYNI